MESMSVLMRLAGGAALMTRTPNMRRPCQLIGFIH